MDHYAIPVINNVQGKAIPNRRLNLKQGDVPSMHFFAFAIDPVLVLLERMLKGILIHSTPTAGPNNKDGSKPMPVEERYKIMGYADDAKPSITSLEEFMVVDHACALFEAASGCRLHRDPVSKKCAFLPLGRWRATLKQEDIPCQYMTITDHLEMVGCDLRATWSQTKKANGDILQKKIQQMTNSWKSGKFMDLSMRGFSCNTYLLSKCAFRDGHDKNYKLY